MEYKLPPIGRIYIQDYDYSCGPCCILNLLTLKGRYGKYTEEEMILFCNSNETEGTTREGLIRGLESSGLEIAEEKENALLADIDRHLGKKHFVIVNYFHLYANVGHYGVIFDSDPEGYYLLDSSLGLLRLDKPDFEKHWHSHDNTLRHHLIALI